MFSEPHSAQTASAQVEGPTCSSKYRIPGGYTVEFTLDNLRLDCAWSPDVPRLNQRLLQAYRLARDHFMRSVIAPGTTWGVLEI